MHPSNIDLMWVVTINYTNYKGQTANRKIVPHSIHFGKTEFHPQPQWLLTATDIDKNELRVFALKDIHSWINSWSDS
jgi:predicted DNA-binding transcriptional regulator YafY